MNKLFDLVAEGGLEAFISSAMAASNWRNARDNNGATLLHKAIETDNDAATIWLLANDAPVDRQDYLGYTPLHLAVVKHKNWLVDSLLRSGCDVNIPDSLGSTALHKACYIQDLSIVSRLLKEPDININAETNDGLTPLDMLFASQPIAEVLRANRARLGSRIKREQVAQAV